MEEQENKRKDSALLQKMEKIEALLTEQVEQGKRAHQSARLHTIVLVAFVAVFAIGFFVLDATLKDATRELPTLLESITQLADTADMSLGTTIGKLEEIDFTALNATIQGIASIKFDALSNSIESLQSIIKPFATFMGAFG